MLVALRVAAAAAMVVTLSACGGDEGAEETTPTTSTVQTTTEAPAPEVTDVSTPEGRAPRGRELVGTWSKVGLPLLQWRFNSDGTFAFDRTTVETPYSRGTYELEGKTIRFVAMGVGCVDHWAWKAGIVEEDGDRLLNITFVDPACGQIAGVEWTFLRIAD